MADVTAPSPLSGVSKIDRVWIAVAAILAGIAIWDLAQAETSLIFLIEALIHIAPFLAVSVLVAAYSTATGLDKQIGIAFSGAPVRAVMLAAVFGALSPFCSCGVVPIIAGLLGAGVPLAPVMAFWLASPLMDPEMFILMIPEFGESFTVAKTVFAMGIGAAAGLITLRLVHLESFASPLLEGVGGGCCKSSCGGPKLKDEPIVWKFWTDSARRSSFSKQGMTSGLFLLKWLTLAFLVESLMVAYLPAEQIGAALGDESIWAVPAAVLVGIPAYMNGYAAIPTVSGLIELGMSPAAGMGFMLGGGITSIPAAMAVFAIVKRPVFLTYLALGLSGALVSAYLFGAFVAMSA